MAGGPRAAATGRGAPGRVWSGHGSSGQGGHERFERGGPALPAGAARSGGDGLDELLPERFPVAAEGVLDDRGRQREHNALPGRVEGQLAVTAGQVQPGQAQRGGDSRATPIIESRVTRAAGSAPVMPSVAAGAGARRGSRPRRRSPTTGSPPPRAAGSPSRPARPDSGKPVPPANDPPPPNPACHPGHGDRPPARPDLSAQRHRMLRSARFQSRFDPAMWRDRTADIACQAVRSTTVRDVTAVARSADSERLRVRLATRKVGRRLAGYVLRWSSGCPELSPGHLVFSCRSRVVSARRWCR